MRIGRLETASVEQAFESLGAVVISFSNAGSTPVLEPAPGEAPLWIDTRVTALLPETTDRSEVERMLKSRWADADLASLDFTELIDRDWVREWNEGLQPMRFGKRLWVHPAKPEQHNPENVDIHLEPGLAFGTGMHPTTAMCLEWLEQDTLAGSTVLDYGSGSGVLAIAALALGAADAVAVDIDPQALISSHANAARNGFGARLVAVSPPNLPADAKYDVILANILSGTLIDLSATLATAAAPGARIALSGILAEQSEGVCQAYADWISLSPQNRREDWVLITGKRTL